jgi:hypothetical protein
MARGGRKPRGQFKPKSQAPSAISYSPTGGDKEDSTPGSNPSKGWWEKQKEPRVSHLAVEIIVAVSLGCLGILAGGTWILWDRWTDEIGQHRKAIDQAQRAEQRESDSISERNQLRQLVANQRQKITDLEKLSPILKFYGPRTMLVRSFDLPKEAGQMLPWGNCPKDPLWAPADDLCIRFMLLGIQKGPNGVEVAQFGLQAVRDTYRVNFDLRLLPGCRAVFAASVYEVTFAIEEVHYLSVKALVGISLGLAAEEKIKNVEYGCPKE